MEGLGRVREVSTPFTVLSPPWKCELSLQESCLSKAGNHVYFEKDPQWFESPTTPLFSSQTFPRLRIMAVFYFPFRDIICVNIGTEKMSTNMWTRVIFEGRYPGDFYFLFMCFGFFYLLNFLINKRLIVILKNKINKKLEVLGKMLLEKSSDSSPIHSHSQNKLKRFITMNIFGTET